MIKLQSKAVATDLINFVTEEEILLYRYLTKMNEIIICKLCFVQNKKKDVTRKNIYMKRQTQE